MGRTLQEGSLSGHIVFPLKGSLAYLRLLWPWHLERFFPSISLPELCKRVGKDVKGKESTVPLYKLLELEILRNKIRDDLFDFAKRSLDVEEHATYSRGSVSGRTPGRQIILRGGN